MGTALAPWHRAEHFSGALVLWCCLAAMRFSAAQDFEDMVEGRINLLWPIHFSSMPLSTPDKASLETPEFGAELSRIALDCFRRYRDTILPQELKIDKKYAAEFAESDHSRVNLAFLRWQKRVFCERTGVQADELSGRGESAPKLDGIDYSWRELYDNPIYKQLLTRFNQVARLYLKRTGYASGDDSLPSKLRIFTWVEVFDKGDAQKPWARTDGAYAMGRYFSQAKQNGLKFNFEDPRGINPPFGKTFSHAAFQGNLIMFPTWLSHFITPNMDNSSQVCFGFLVYPPDGDALDWEEDKTGSVEVPSGVAIPLSGYKAFPIDDRR